MSLSLLLNVHSQLLVSSARFLFGLLSLATRDDKQQWPLDNGQMSNSVAKSGDSKCDYNDAFVVVVVIVIVVVDDDVDDVT